MSDAVITDMDTVHDAMDHAQDWTRYLEAEFDIAARRNLEAAKGISSALDEVLKGSPAGTNMNALWEREAATRAELMAARNCLRAARRRSYALTKEAAHLSRRQRRKA